MTLTSLKRLLTMCFFFLNNFSFFNISLVLLFLTLNAVDDCLHLDEIGKIRYKTNRFCLSCNIFFFFLYFFIERFVFEFYEMSKSNDICRDNWLVLYLYEEKNEKDVIIKKRWQVFWMKRKNEHLWMKKRNQMI